MPITFTNSNKGNFIELVKILSKYDPILGKHYLKESYDKRWYLSPKIQNEFIILGNHVKENILDLIRKANNFAIILDSTPGISHTDQMSSICRYVVFEDKEVEVRKSFLGFITELGKTAYNIKKMILDLLEKEKLVTSLNIRAIGLIFIRKLTKFRPICPSAFFRCFISAETRDEVSSPNILSENDYQASS